ncbi:mxaA protein [Arboricoccus pini]|uniref:MxaA protein n=1 Tax=Arboricoccus pini TaxID=1963835 RepID=A0A212R0R3_9PROT|nr:nonribosomal peptide synthetase MxaA [Arboricoccus pini]SNB65514.1 mxaA protein [Arboricoccus pini]
MNCVWRSSVLSIALLGSLAVFPGPYAAMAQVRSVDLSLPREYGFFIGDTLESDVEIEVAKGTHLLAASLPATGRVTYWLELRDFKLTTTERPDTTLYRLAMRYQTFYAPLDTRRMKVPGFDLQFEAGSQTIQAKVPDWSFVTSSLREIEPGGRDADELLAPDFLAQPLALRSDELRLLGLSLLFLISLGGLGYHRAWWPFHNRPARPFARTARVIAKDRGLDGAGAMGLLHRAFDASFGCRLLADDLPTFLAKKPEMRPFAGEITSFFAQSRSFFFGTGVAVTRAEAARLARLLARAERGRP